MSKFQSETIPQEQGDRELLLSQLTAYETVIAETETLGMTVNAFVLAMRDEALRRVTAEDFRPLNEHQMRGIIYQQTTNQKSYYEDMRPRGLEK